MSTNAADLSVAQNPMVGHWVFLRPILPEDSFFLNQVASHPATGAFWRWQGLPRGGDPIRATWPNTLASFIVTARKTGEPTALAIATNPDMLSRTCAMSYVARPEAQHTGWHLEGALLFLHYLFRAWDMRKIYLEVLGYNENKFERSVGKSGIREEGRLREHVLMDGRYHDLIHYAIYRDEWLAGTASFMRRATGLADTRFISRNGDDASVNEPIAHAQH